MISIKIKKKENNFLGVEIFGHSNYNESGNDIVCAAISILGYNLINSIYILGKIDDEFINVTENEDDGLLIFDITKTNKKTNLLFESFLIGVELMLEEYSDYITLKYEEV